MGAGRRGIAAGASHGRRRGQARAGSLRRAWRQDGAARARRRLRGRRRHLQDAAQDARRQISRGSVLPPTTVAADATTWSPGESLRRDSARRAVLIDRHHPPASRHPLSQIAEGHRGRWPRSRRGFSTMPRRCSSPAARSSIRPARSSPRKARPRSPRCSPETLTSRSIRSCLMTCLGRRIGYSPRASCGLFPISSTSGRRNGAAWTDSSPRA